MAKFKTLSGKSNSIYCSVLNESESDYLVQFKNGVIRNVPKSRVYDLDEIDEGVIDTLKSVAGKVKDFITRIVANARGVFFFDGDRQLQVNSPYTTMIAAEKVPGVEFIPGDDIIAGSKALGITAKATEDDTVSDSIEESLKKYGIDFLLEAAGTNINGGLDTTNPDLVHLDAKDSKTGKEYIRTVNLKKLMFFIGVQLANLRRTGKAGAKPICVWGAPGIGKTSIIKNAVKKLQKHEGRKFSFLGLNARTMYKDDFQIAAFYVKETNGSKKAIGTDVPKAWLPVYNPNDAKTQDELIKLDAIANGSVFDDKTGEEIVKGTGGIMFIDELSRVNEDVLDAIMSLFSEGELGSTGYKLGSKWLVVAAANRRTDMKGQKKSTNSIFDPATEQRMLSLNFAPTVDEWLEWATDKDELGQPNVIPEICSFLQTHPTYFYVASPGDASPHAHFTDISRISATPRRWTDMSDLFKYYLNMKAFNDVDPDVAEVFDDLGIVPESYPDLKSIPLDDKELICDITVGEDVGRIFLASVDADPFTMDDAENVWKKGSKGTYDVMNGGGAAAIASGSFASFILPKLIDCNPHANDANPVPPGALENVVDFLWALASAGSNGQQNSVPIFTQMIGEFNKEALSKWKIDYLNADNKAYNKVQNLILDYTQDIDKNYNA